MKYVIYSNTDYLDVLTVHADYLKFEENFLLINSNNLDLESLYSKFTQVIFYDDKLPYASRVLNCINKIDSEYVLFIHDIDIPLNIDFDTFNGVMNYCESKKLDRVDLQQDIRIDRRPNLSSEIIETENFLSIPFEEANNHYCCLVRNDDASNYIYNVNPSVWKLDTFKEILGNFQSETYRSIENNTVQNFCQKFKIYKLSSKTKMNSGYYSITPIFQFLHITHEGGLMPLDGEVNGADEHINSEYFKILSTYKFTKPLRRFMH